MTAAGKCVRGVVQPYRTPTRRPPETRCAIYWTGTCCPSRKASAFAKRRGRFFFEAARQLKWDAVGCIELPNLGDVKDAETVKQLAEIAENLHRREIDALERDELLAAWAKLRVERKGVSGRPVQKLSKRGRENEGRPSGGISQTARDLGLHRKAVERATKVAALSPEAKTAARAVGLADNQTALLKAAKQKEPAAQVAVLEEHVSKTRPVPPTPDPSISLKTAWGIASPAGRAGFIAWLRAW